MSRCILFGHQPVQVTPTSGRAAGRRVIFCQVCNKTLDAPCDEVDHQEHSLGRQPYGRDELALDVMPDKVLLTKVPNAR